MIRFRWSIRTVMAVVAVMAAALKGYELHERGRSYRLLAAHHLAASHSNRAISGRPLFCSNARKAGQVETNTERGQALTAARCHEALYDKYIRAAERPWLPVEPDPPPPIPDPALVSADEY